jgi:polysaccharide biosynthesis protein PelF
MRICLIVEGSYPYITGGVSTWIHSLISNMTEHEFIIYTIGVQKSNIKPFKYALPANVIEIKETFMNDLPHESNKIGLSFRMSKSQKAAFLAMLDPGENADWDNFFTILQSKKFRSIDQLLISKDYFDIVVKLCKIKYAALPFSEMYWTVHSIVLPLLISLCHEIPKADLYHSVSAGYAGIIGSLAKYLTGKPYILTEHGIYYQERKEEINKSDRIKEPYKKLWINHFYQLSASAYHYSDQVITLYNGNREIEIELGCKADKIKIIPNGVNVQDYSNTLTPLYIDEQPIRLGAIVRVVPIKDIKMMIQSFALVKQDIPNAELYIMGPTDENENYYQECLQLIKIMQLEGIVFTGDVDVKEYLGQVNILLLTSISEGMPFAVLEGMACSKPYITTDAGSCRELLHGLDDNLGPSGIIVPIKNYVEMALAIVKLCKDQKLREEMGRTGLNRVSKYYSSECFIEGYRKVYEAYRELKTWQV